MTRYFKVDFEFGIVIWYEKDGYRVSFCDPSPGNTEWHEYQQWLAEGNTPELWNPEEQ